MGTTQRISRAMREKIADLWDQGKQVQIIAFQMDLPRKTVEIVLKGRAARGQGEQGVADVFREMSIKEEHTPEEEAWMDEQIAIAKAEVQSTWDVARERQARGGRPDDRYELPTVEFVDWIRK